MKNHLWKNIALAAALGIVTSAGAIAGDKGQHKTTEAGSDLKQMPQDPDTVTGAMPEEDPDMSGAARAAETMAAPGPIAKLTPEQARAHVKAWPADSKKAAEATITKYGAPDEVTATTMMWKGNGPWKWTKIDTTPTDHKFPVPHKDVMEMAIDFDIPEDKVDELARYDGSVVADRTRGELSARCDKEEANFLALNLAHDIVRGTKSVEQARQSYADTVEKLMKGEKGPYVTGLVFTPQSKTADADEPWVNKNADRVRQSER